MTPPVLVYLGMGLLVARIELDGRQTRGFTWLQWLQYLVDAARITLLWPLVLLVEKVSAWLKPDSEAAAPLEAPAIIETPAAPILAEPTAEPNPTRRAEETRVFIFTGENKE